MHIIVLIIGTALGVMFWLNRMGRGAGEVIDAAQTLSNMPRRNRHRRAVNRRGMALVETPVEAATVLMLSISRMSEDRRLSSRERARIERQLVLHMQMEADDADGITRQMELVHDDIILPEATLFPMVDILLPAIGKDDARRLADMMNAVAEVHGKTHEQAEFVRRYRERMGLGG
ncbi:hypothetical protein GCM10009069_13890 [Algimonas arctica]|jgi:hypothetical protein|uniref:Co-chaperone DjlA N-terminal domain-containing protein n=1 Tax=Algimonas arctica TaxID=1479486 RepID=A0A8J3CSD5_9PROT|nr:hypothetical protein [Algimonas arctica]GHA91900.1 hypothetical protein GCM10009069_13890 [Algimonas arctica]